MRLTPAPTRGNGDCAFHALFGQWNGQEYVYDDIKSLRQRVANQIRAISIASHALFPSVSEAIKELIRGNHQNLSLDRQTFPLITQRQQQYNKDHEGFEDLASFEDDVNSAIVKEYANFIETPNMWLLPCELSILAQIRNVTVRYFIDDHQAGEKYRLVERFNPNTQEEINVYFNGINHYEAMRINHLPLTHVPSPARLPIPPQSSTLSIADSHKASGSKKILHGIIYQLKLLILFLYRGYKQEHESCLSTERDDAEKFDDLVFKYKHVGSTDYSYRFLQAKHKQDDNEVISEIDLLNINDGEFSLIKYFAAFQKIKNNPIFGDGILEEFCICTNIGFDFDPARDAQSNLHIISALEKMTDPDPLLDTQGTKATKYRFKHSDFPGKAALYKHIRQNTPRIRLAQELKKQIKYKNKIDLRNPLLKAHNEWLIQNGIIHDKTLTPNFTHGTNLSPAATDFRAYYHGTLTEDLSLSEAEIDDFLKHLVFAVNQPDEVSLQGILVQELADEFNLQENSELLYAELQNVTLAWMKDKRGTFLTHHTTKALFDELRQKLSRLALIGPTLDYQKKLQQLGYNFSPAQPVKDFINGKNQVMIYSTPGDVFLGSMQVYQTLQSIDIYKADNSYIVITLKKALRLKQLISESFTKNRLLVIACNIPLTNSAEAFLQELFSHLPQQVKIILITAHPQALNTLIRPYPIKVSTYEANGDFSELDRATQVSLQNRVIHFQGVSTSLGELIPDLDEVIDATVLAELISTRQSIIGTPLATDELAYFIERKFKRALRVSPKCLTKNKEDIFAIVSTRPNRLARVIKDNVKDNATLQPFSEATENTNLSHRFILLDQEYTAEQFKILCNKYPNHSLHHLVHHKNNRLHWQNSHGSLNNLRPHLESIRDIAELQEGCSIISAEPGMGKTTILSSLIHTLKQNNPTIWIFNISLLAIESKLSAIEFTDQKSIVDFFMQDATHLERKVFEYRLAHGGIAFFLDGFDEIQTRSQTKIIRLLNLLKTTHAEKIVVTTRRHMENKLEESLSTLSYRLQSFKNEDTYVFFEKFWQKLLKLENIDTNKVTLYANTLIDIFTPFLDETRREFIGIPLQAQLLATASVKEFQQFYEGEEIAPHFAETIPLFELYERFVKTKYEIALKDKLKLIDHMQQSIIGPILIEKLEEYHQQLAMPLLFPHVHQLANPLQISHISLVNIAGMMQFINGEARAVHRTFAEFFAATFLIAQLQKPSHYSEYQAYHSLLISNIFKPRYEVIRTFIEEMVEHSTHLSLPQAWQTIRDCNLLPIAPHIRKIEEDDLKEMISSDESSDSSSSRKTLDSNGSSTDKSSDSSLSSDKSLNSSSSSEISDSSLSSDESSDSSSSSDESSDSYSSIASSLVGQLDIYDSSSESDSDSSEESDSAEENTYTYPVQYPFETAERLLRENYAKDILPPKDMTNLKRYLTNFYSHLFNTQDLPRLEKGIQLLNDVLRKACFIEIKKHAVGRLELVLDHYIQACDKAGILFNIQVIQSFTDIIHPGKKNGRKLLADRFTILNEFHTLKKSGQQITPLFLAKLTEGKILYLSQINHLEVNDELMESLVSAYPRVKFQKNIYKKLLLKIAILHPPFIDKLHSMIVKQGDIPLLETINRAFPDMPIELMPADIIAMAQGKSATWLEKEGFALLNQQGILTPQIIQKFQRVLSGEIAHTHAYKIWEDLITALLNRPSNEFINSNINSTALLTLCVDVLEHLSIKEKNTTSLSISTLAISNLLKLIENNLTQRAQIQTMLSHCITLLVYLNKTGLLLIDIGKGLLVLEPRSEFEYELHYHPELPLPQLILCRAKESIEVFQQKCGEAILSMQEQESGSRATEQISLINLPHRNFNGKRDYEQITPISEHAIPDRQVRSASSSGKKRQMQEIE